MTVCVLGLDLATRRCGWCVGDGSFVPEAGAWLFPQVENDLGALGEMALNALDSLFERFGVSHLAFEAPMLNPKRDKLLTLRKIYGLEFLVEAHARRRLGRANVGEVGLRKVKAELTGNSLAEKDDMVRVAAALGVVLPKSEDAGKKDAADAVGVWKVGIREWAPRPVSTDWDVRVIRARAGLGRGPASLL